MRGSKWQESTVHCAVDGCYHWDEVGVSMEASADSLRPEDGYYVWEALLAVWLSGNVLASINVVSLRQTQLVLGWVTVCGRVNHLGM